MRKHRMVMSVEGPEGAGKSHLALTAPGPIQFFDLDRGLEGLEEKFLDKEILRHEFRITFPHGMPTEGPSAQAWQRNAASQVMDAVCDALRIGRTVVVDKADQLWGAVQMGYADETFERRVNIFNRMIQDAYDCDANLILLHGIRVVFAKNKSGQSYPNGDMTCAGWDGIRSAVQLAVATRYTGNGYEFSPADGVWIKANSAAVPGTFEQHVLKSRDNVGLVGLKLTNQDFPTLCGMAFPNLDWSV